VDDEARVTRLVGGNRASGGGLPLSDAFRAICRQLMNDPVPERLVVINVARELSLDRERVADGWGSWEKLTADLLAQLEYAGMALRIATPGGDEWTLGARFRTATRMMPIPGSNVWFAVYTQEETVQRNAAAEVRKDLAHARRILEEAGMLTPEMAEALTVFDEGLSFPESGRTERRMRERSSVDHGIPRPQDEPGEVIFCRKCEKSKPKMKKFFEVYWHTKSGDWYWRLVCQSCRKDATDTRLVQRREKVGAAVIRLHEQGITPTVEGVAEITKINRGDTAAAWNYLARRNLVPVPLPGKVLSRKQKEML
jgi:hypothetical protein